MKKINIGEELVGSQIVLGCMRISDMAVEKVEELVETALDSGINYFDHADIYGRGKSEEVFGKALKKHSDWRDKMVVQTKCGIVPGKMFDFSTKHIINSVEGSLTRLGLENIDVLLLHRPDTLMQPEEVADAFSQLSESGKVKYFGVSNCNPMQIELLKTCVHQPLIINQLQFSAAFTSLVDSGINVNMTRDKSTMRDGSILEYSRIKDITIQAWSPMQYGFFEGVFIGSEKYKPLNAKLEELGKKYGVTPSAVAVAFISRHPANIQTILGTTNAARVKEICLGNNVTLTREEWYAIYLAAGNILP